MTGQELPTSLAREYELLEMIGEGGMSVVHRVRQRSTGRELALKRLKGGIDDEIARLWREARALASLRHPSIVSIFDAGVEDGIAYTLCELVEGHSLREELTGAPASPARILETGCAIAAALAEAHRTGFIHRDVKPENILCPGSASQNSVKLADFGIARPLRSRGSLTAPGMILGTPGYLAPEQIRGEGATPAIDQYALGVVLHEMAAGKPPFAGKDLPTLLRKPLLEDPPHLDEIRQDLPRGLAAIVRQLLDREPSRRFKSMQEVARRLEEVRDVTTSDPVRVLPGPLRHAQATLLTPAHRAKPAWGRRGAVAGTVIMLTVLSALAFLVGRPRIPVPDTTFTVAEATPPASPSREADSMLRMKLLAFSLLERIPKQESQVQLLPGVSVPAAGGTGSDQASALFPVLVRLHDEMEAAAAVPVIGPAWIELVDPATELLELARQVTYTWSGPRPWGVLTPAIERLQRFVHLPTEDPWRRDLHQILEVMVEKAGPGLSQDRRFRLAEAHWELARHLERDAIEIPDRSRGLLLNIRSLKHALRNWEATAVQFGLVVDAHSARRAEALETLGRLAVEAIDRPETYSRGQDLDLALQNCFGAYGSAVQGVDPALPEALVPTAIMRRIWLHLDPESAVSRNPEETVRSVMRREPRQFEGSPHALAHGRYLSGQAPLPAWEGALRKFLDSLRRCAELRSELAGSMGGLTGLDLESSYRGVLEHSIHLLEISRHVARSQAVLRAASGEPPPPAATTLMLAWAPVIGWSSAILSLELLAIFPEGMRNDPQRAGKLAILETRVRTLMEAMSAAWLRDRMSEAGDAHIHLLEGAGSPAGLVEQSAELLGIFQTIGLWLRSAPWPRELAKDAALLQDKVDRSLAAAPEGVADPRRDLRDLLRLGRKLGEETKREPQRRLARELLEEVLPRLIRSYGLKIEQADEIKQALELKAR